MQPIGRFFRFGNFAIGSSVPSKEQRPAKILKSCGTNSVKRSVSEANLIRIVSDGARSSRENKKTARPKGEASLATLNRARRSGASVKFSNANEMSAAWRMPLAADFTLGVSQSVGWASRTAAFMT